VTIIFEDRAFKEVIEVKGGLYSGAPNTFNWCPYKKRKRYLRHLTLSSRTKERPYEDTLRKQLSASQEEPSQETKPAHTLDFQPPEL